MNCSGKSLPIWKKPLFWAATFVLAAAAFLAVLFVLHIWNPTPDVHSSPSLLANAYMENYKKGDYDALLALKLTEQSETEEELKTNKQMLQSTKINGIKCVDKYEGKSFACYQYQIDVSDEGISTLRKGENPRWLYMRQKSGNWYVEGFMTCSPSPQETPGKYLQAK